MTAAKDHDLDAVRAHLAALREDADTKAASAQLGSDLARIRSDLQRLAEAHAEAWRRMEPLAPTARQPTAGEPSQAVGDVAL